MTVAELIVELSKFDPDLIAALDDGYAGEIEVSGVDPHKMCAVIY